MNVFDPDPQTSLDVRAVDLELDNKLTGKAAAEALAAAIRAAAFEFEPDDYVAITTAESLTVRDAEDYARGYELMSELASLESRITAHYSRFDKPLNFLIRVVRELKSPQTQQVSPIKKALSARLGAWKVAEDERARQEAQRKQAAEDAAARAAQAARAASLDRVADQEPDPKLAESFRREADAVRAVQVHGAPVEPQPSTPKVNGYTKVTWKCEFDDVKELMRAYVEGRCFLDEEAIKRGLQSSMDDQAATLQKNLGKAFPGTRAVAVPKAIARRRTT